MRAIRHPHGEHLAEWDLGENIGTAVPTRNMVRKLRRKPGEDAEIPTYVFDGPRVALRMPETENRNREEAEGPRRCSIILRGLSLQGACNRHAGYVICIPSLIGR